MTTAHRPTWKAAVGRANEGGWTAGGALSTAISARDAPAHTALKFRKGHQVVEDKQEILKKSLLALEQAEAKAPKLLQWTRRPMDEEEEKQAKLKLLKQTAEVDEKKIKERYADSDVDDSEDSDDDENSNAKNGKRDKGEEEEESDLDDSDSDDSESSEDDDEDDEAALQAELLKIRAERDEAKRKAEEEAAAAENERDEEAALLGNPLLAATTSGAGGNNTNSGRMKRRWNDDVVFRNQAKGEPQPKKRFINDTVRNDFHKRFLNKFMR